MCFASTVGGNASTLYSASIHPRRVLFSSRFLNFTCVLSKWWMSWFSLFFHFSTKQDLCKAWGGTTVWRRYPWPRRYPSLSGTNGNTMHEHQFVIRWFDIERNTQVPLPPAAWPRKVEPWGATNYLADSGAVLVNHSQEPVMVVSGTGRKKVLEITDFYRFMCNAFCDILKMFILGVFFGCIILGEIKEKTRKCTWVLEKMPTFISSSVEGVKSTIWYFCLLFDLLI